MVKKPAQFMSCLFSQKSFFLDNMKGLTFDLLIFPSFFHQSQNWSLLLFPPWGKGSDILTDKNSNGNYPGPSMMKNVSRCWHHTFYGTEYDPRNLIKLGMLRTDPKTSGWIAQRTLLSHLSRVRISPLPILFGTNRLFWC